MKHTLAHTMTRSLLWLLLIGGSAALAVQGIYLYKFGIQLGEWGTLSDKQEVWGQYGDYIGGLLNPIFSSLAFSGLVVTIVLQARQIDNSERNAELEEMQRVQSSIAARIDHMLWSDTILSSTDTDELELRGLRPQTVFDLTSALGSAALHDPTDTVMPWHSWLWNSAKGRELRKKLENQTRPLRLEFESLSFMLQKYEENQGSPVVIEFYKYRFTAVLVWLDELGMLKAHSRVQAFFKPKDSSAQMRMYRPNKESPASPDTNEK